MGVVEKMRAMRSDRNLWLAALLALVIALAIALPTAGCGEEEETTTTAAQSSTPVAPETTTTAAAETTTTVAKSDLILASTTSTQDSGLFDALIPAFSEAYPQYTVKVVAVGSGEALKLGETGDADVLLVHSPAAEEEFMANGYGVEREAVMYNDYIIVGPAVDPAKIKGMTDASDASAAIAAAEALFFSRGDDSGTNNKEKAIWKEAGITPEGDWYQTTGQGMGETLTIADQKSGYTLSDRATYLSKKDALALEILVGGDKALFNQYHVLSVAKAKNPQGGTDFLNWIISPPAQELIGTFGIEEFGQPLFVPNAGQAE